MKERETKESIKLRKDLMKKGIDKIEGNYAIYKDGRKVKLTKIKYENAGKLEK